MACLHLPFDKASSVGTFAKVQYQSAFLSLLIACVCVCVCTHTHTHASVISQSLSLQNSCEILMLPCVKREKLMCTSCVYHFFPSIISGFSNAHETEQYTISSLHGVTIKANVNNKNVLSLCGTKTLNTVCKLSTPKNITRPRKTFIYRK